MRNRTDHLHVRSLGPRELEALDVASPQKIAALRRKHTREADE